MQRAVQTENRIRAIFRPFFVHAGACFVLSIILCRCPGQNLTGDAGRPFRANWTFGPQTPEPMRGCGSKVMNAGSDITPFPACIGEEGFSGGHRHRTPFNPPIYPFWRLEVLEALGCLELPSCPEVVVVQPSASRNFPGRGFGQRNSIGQGLSPCEARHTWPTPCEITC